jgi:hypothetical protein
MFTAISLRKQNRKHTYSDLPSFKFTLPRDRTVRI